MSEKWKQYFYLYLFAITQVPMIFFTRPRIVAINDRESRILIPYKRRNRNHVKSIYIGALSVGADLCVGLFAMHLIRKINPGIILIFKDLSCDFIKKAMGPTEFVCTQAEEMKALVEKANQTGERQTQTFSGQAFSRVGNTQEHVMNFSITLSIKARHKS